MNERTISIAYGLAGGAALVSLGVPELVVIPLGVTVGMIGELWNGYNK